MTLLYSLTLFWSALLLFCIEPLIAKMLLPIAGGAPSVWNTCLVFFQVVLLGGYAFAHWSLRALGARRQALLGAALVTIAFIALPIAIPKTPIVNNPASTVLMLLLASVGAPFFALSTMAPTLQRWFSVTGSAGAKDPYFLYAASNLGSLGALLGYPLFIEPRIGLHTQSQMLRVGYGVLVALAITCAIAMRRTSKDDSDLAERSSKHQAIAWVRRLRWMLLAAIPSAHVVALTTHITTDITPAPLFWAIPLGTYLLTFVLVFAKRPPIPHAWVVRALPLTATIGVYLISFGGNSPLWLVVLLHVLLQFEVALYCHGEMATDRPPPAWLPEFFLWTSTGGALGGIAAALVAPLVMALPLEYPACVLFALACRPSAKQTMKTVLWACAVVGVAFACAFVARTGTSGLVQKALLAVPLVLAFPLSDKPRAFVASLAGVVVATLFYPDAFGRVVLRERSFFGALAVVRDDENGATTLMHGNTVHGMQLARKPRSPTLYFARGGAVSDVISLAGSLGLSNKYAVTGLGVGTLASYALPGQSWKFFELDPEVVRIATDKQYFTYLTDAFPDGPDIVTGDARLELQHAEGGYELLILDAFSSDSIPMHLITREAFALYRSKVVSGGIVLWHVSNRHLDLRPVLAALAEDAGWSVLSRDDLRVTSAASRWAAMSASPGTLEPLRATGWHPIERPAGFECWTDDRASIISIITR